MAEVVEENGTALVLRPPCLRCVNVPLYRVLTSAAAPKWQWTFHLTFKCVITLETEGKPKRQKQRERDRQRERERDYKKASAASRQPVGTL